jgi:hypothetical protein
MKKKAGIVFFICIFFLLGTAMITVHGEMVGQEKSEKGGNSPEDRAMRDYGSRTPHGYHMYREQHMQPRRPESPDQQGWFCPWCGQAQGPDEYEGQGGRGAYGPENRYYRGWMLRYMYPWYHGARFWNRGLSLEDARLLLEKELGIDDNRHLKIGKATEHKTYYEFELLTRDDALIDRVQVHRYTGWFRSAYGSDG